MEFKAEIVIHCLLSVTTFDLAASSMLGGMRDLVEKVLNLLGVELGVAIFDNERDSLLGGYSMVVVLENAGLCS